MIGWIQFSLTVFVRYGKRNAAELQAAIVAKQEQDATPPPKVIPWDEPVTLDKLTDQYVVENKFPGRTAGTSLIVVLSKRRDGVTNQVVDGQEYKLFMVFWLTILKLDEARNNIII